MGSTNKGFSLLFVVFLAVSSLMVVESAAAQSIPKPSVPEFNLKYVDHSYDMPPTYSTDQYTGKTIMTQAGYRVENKSIEVTIKNQPFIPYRDANGNYLDLHYDIRWKGHFGDYWVDYNSSREYLMESFSQFYDNGLPKPNSPFKVMTFSLGNNSDNSNYGYNIRDISGDGQIDFQVQAFIGYYTRINVTVTNPAELQFTHGETPYYYSFTGQSSGWSNTQTITIGETASNSPNPTSSLNPTTAPTSMPSDATGNLISVPLSTLVGVVAILLAIIVVLSLLLLRRHPK
jgi:hypothetical protein